MAQITALQIYGLPGILHSFTAKEEQVVVVPALWTNATENNTVSWSGATENNSATWTNATENNTVTWSNV